MEQKKSGTNNPGNPLSPWRERRSRNIGSIHRKSTTQNKIFTTTWKRKQHQHLDLLGQVLGSIQNTQLHPRVESPKTEYLP